MTKWTKIEIRKDRLKQNKKCCGGESPSCKCSPKEEKIKQSHRNHFNEIFNR